MRGRWMILGLVVVGSLAPACREVSAGEEPAANEPARLEPIEGTDQVAVILTERAAERIDLQTATVESTGGGQVVIPYAAVFYGLNGETWTYTSPEPLTFVREPIAVHRVEGDLAYLSEGPPPGTTVVTVGAVELFGVETDVGG